MEGNIISLGETSRKLQSVLRSGLFFLKASINLSRDNGVTTEENEGDFPGDEGLLLGLFRGIINPSSFPVPLQWRSPVFYHPILGLAGVLALLSIPATHHLFGTESLPPLPPTVPALVAVAPPATPNPEAILADLAQAQVVYLGETHDRPEDHAAQLTILQALHRQNPNLILGLEMFQRPFQGVIDRYLAGSIDETSLRRDTEYDERWGFDWELYAPLLRFAQAQGIKVLALNTPTEITRKVARQGLDSITEADRRYVPAPADIDTSDPGYRAFLEEIFQQSHHGHGNSAGFENFVAAQVLWDETMAATIADHLRANPTQPVVVLMGHSHGIYGYGIPQRVQRRLGADVVQKDVVQKDVVQKDVVQKDVVQKDVVQKDVVQKDLVQKDLVQKIVLINPPPEFAAAGPGAIADYFWYTSP